MDKSWSEEVLQLVIGTVAEEFKREVRDEDMTFDDFVRLRARLWRRWRARQELRQAWERLKECGTRCVVVIACLEMGDDSGGSDQDSFISEREFEPAEVPMVAKISWCRSEEALREPRRVKWDRRRYDRERAEVMMKVADRSERKKKRRAKLSRSTPGRGVVKKIWKVRGRRKKRMKRRGRTKAVKMSKPWKAVMSKTILVGRAAKISFGHRKRELHGLRPQEAWLAWTSARDGIG
jgi:hypothetical protein